MENLASYRWGERW